MTQTQKGYRLGIPGVTVAGTGTISTSGTALTGSVGTSFTTELYAGAIIISDNETVAVASVTDVHTAVLQTAPLHALSNDTFVIVPMLLLSDMTVPVTHPKSIHKQWQEQLDLVSGLSRGIGRPSTTWTWGYITQAQYDQLRVYLTGASRRVYIYTRTTENADSYKVYQAAAIMPTDIDRQTTRRIGFSIEFRDLILL